MGAYKPLYITVEGLDGCGKTTLSQRLGDYLEESGLPFRKVSMLPEGSIREAVLKDTSLTPIQRLVLIATAAQTAYKTIDETMANGMSVLSDRGIDSFYAYQGHGDRLLPKVVEIVGFFGSRPVPDITFFIDLPPKLCQERMVERGTPLDIIEKQDSAFHQRVYEGYLWQRDTFPDRIITLDGSMKPGAVARDAVLHLEWHIESFFS